MVPWSILCEHATALVLVWAWVGLAGFALLPILRLRIGLVGVPLVGVVYWTLALYLFPFIGGLDVAAVIVGLFAIVAVARRQTPFRLAWRHLSLATLLLVIGSLPYTTTLWFHYVPFGMDGSMHTTAAALIARAGGLPQNHAPFAPDLAFPPMNLGLSTVGALAIRWGGEPAAVMLACHHLTFTLLMLATYLLLRSWTRRTSAALFAVLTVWTARASQASLEWGGFPTVLSVAVGIFAARLIWQQARSRNCRLSLGAGAAIAAIPLIHGVGAGTWLYCVGPWITLAALLHARDRKSTLRGLLESGIFAALFLLAYRAAGSIEVQADAMEGTHLWQQQSTPLVGNAWLAALEYIRKDSGSLIVLTGWGACAALLFRRQWRSALLLAGAWLTLVAVVANSRWWVLPASFLLYPERAIYWAAPLSAVSLALALRAWRPTRSENVQPVASMSIGLRAGLVLGLLCVAGYQQNQFYQKIVRTDFIDADGWEALLWAKQHLNPQHDFVQTPYLSTGSFLPSIAQIGCSGAHHHHFIAEQVQQMLKSRTVTHVLMDQKVASAANFPTGQVVFRNRTIMIMEISDASPKRRETE